MKSTKFHSQYQQSEVVPRYWSVLDRPFSAPVDPDKYAARHETSSLQPSREATVESLCKAYINSPSYTKYESSTR